MIQLGNLPAALSPMIRFLHLQNILISQSYNCKAQINVTYIISMEIFSVKHFIRIKNSLLVLDF